MRRAAYSGHNHSEFVVRHLGFTPGAKLKREHERTASQRRVDFNQGVDARILC